MNRKPTLRYIVQRFTPIVTCAALSSAFAVACGNSDSNQSSRSNTGGNGASTAAAGATNSAGNGALSSSGAGGQNNGGTAGGGGSAGSTLSVTAACSAACAAQAALSCTLGDACSAACVTQASAPNPKGQSCQSESSAMLDCEAGLGANQWTCSDSDDNAIPTMGSCDTSVCAWACCASSLVADGDVWSRCSATCPASGSGGAGGAGGTAGTDSGGGSAGSSSAGSSGNAGGSGGSSGGVAGAPKTSAAMRMICSGTNPISCHFGGSPGDYAVTLDLGGSAAAYTEIQAEMNRAMLKPLTTTAGARKEFSFVVNVRTPEGQPVEDGPTEGTPGLDLYFYGSQGGPGETAAAGGTVAPLLDAVGYATPATGRVGLFVAGDSTVCDQTDADYAGWAQLIPASFNYPISIANYADSGESALSFYASGALWKAMLAQVKSGDWVFIQFGHNDKTDATGQFQTAITNMVTQAKNKGAHPVLISPPARATYSGQTLSAQFVYDWGSVQPVMQQVATAQQIPYIDLTSITTTWYNQLGPNGWQAYHALGTDRTHTNRAGASAIADFVVAAIKSQNIGLTQYLR